MNRRESAETLALQAFAWLLAQDDLVGVFLNATGAGQGELAALAGDPVFLGAVLDFLMEDDARVIGFCDDATLPYTAVMQARAALPGGELPNWT
ncbi:MAG: DUF3572 domain-containing protein [Cypionkella sp.]|uniref:DUF3572 domain-containing protein n=1 Tax=Cypionkella sp. TaxID=2811411 RepID=UPI002AB97179|nr:DUF3572 domain-containing protein [Cypionkella sp.]MDZ4309354.1 DUF3572 domain-containing protein [Cypionkella sp.]MDZ4395278.1 DUF3572 domain-containing protein [Cypionkella sp.]